MKPQSGAEAESAGIQVFMQRRISVRATRESAQGRGGTFVFWVPRSSLNGLIIKLINWTQVRES